MARYIDVDELLKKIYPMGIGDGMYVINAKAVKFAIDNTPTADVVPKSEVDWNSIPVDVSEALKQRAVEKAKAEAITEFAERLKTYYRNLDRTAGGLVEYHIDQIVKEFCGATDSQDND